MQIYLMASTQEQTMLDSIVSGELNIIAQLKCGDADDSMGWTGQTGKG